MKAFILRLDGATLEQLYPLMDEGIIPNIKEICTNYTHGPLNNWENKIPSPTKVGDTDNKAIVYMAV